MRLSYVTTQMLSTAALCVPTVPIIQAADLK